MLKHLSQYSIIQHKYVHSYTQGTYVFIHILKYSSVLVVLEVRLTKCQQIHQAVAPAVQQMFTCLFTY